MKLSILIPTIRRHEVFFTRLKFELYSQMLPYSEEVELLIDNHETDSIGTKRNRLLERATGKYLVFCDADDRVCQNYISLLMDGIDKDVDCCSLLGIITFDGCGHQYFEHSIKYNEYKTNENAVFENSEIKYERFPNHISCLRSSIAKSFKFPETSWGEDTDWATQINKIGLLKTEHKIDQILYYYDYRENK